MAEWWPVQRLIAEVRPRDDRTWLQEYDNQLTDPESPAWQVIDDMEKGVQREPVLVSNDNLLWDGHKRVVAVMYLTHHFILVEFAEPTQQKEEVSMGADEKNQLAHVRKRMADLSVLHSDEADGTTSSWWRHQLQDIIAELDAWTLARVVREDPLNDPMAHRRRRLRKFFRWMHERSFMILMASIRLGAMIAILLFAFQESYP